MNEADENITTKALKERVKELNCLLDLTQLTNDPSLSLSEFLQSAIKLIPPSWQYPADTCARIILEDNEFKTSDFKETKHKQQAVITVNKQHVGSIEIFYKKEKPELDEGPFLKEKRR